MVNRLSRRSGEDVPVIGVGDSGSEGGDGPVASRSPRAGRGVALVVAAVLVVTAIVTLVGDEGSDPNPTDVSMALPPPVEPSVVTTAPEPEPPEFALGWKELGLPGYSGGPTIGQVIDAGPSGWVAVTQGNFAQMVHTSRDGVAWRSTTLEEAGWIATVFSGGEGLFVAVSGGPVGAGIWRSVDGGIGWDRSTLPGEEVLVVSVAEAAGRVWAAGVVGSPDPWSTGTPAVWVLEGGDWIPVALEGERGWVASVVEWDGGVWGFGSDRGPVVWDLIGAERYEVSSDVGLGGFRTVVAHQRALWGLYAPGLDQTGRLFTAAADPTEWESVPGLGEPSGLTLEPVGEQLALVDGSQRVLIVGEGPLRARIPDHSTGRENSGSVTGLAVEDGQAAFLGQDSVASETLLWTRGTVSEPIVLLDPERMVWSARRELSAQVWGPMVVWDDRIFMVGEAGVYEWVFGTDLVEVPGGRGVFGLQPTEAGLLGLSRGGVLLLGGNEFDDFGSLPNPDVCGATVVGGVLTVADCQGGVFERGNDGEWSQPESTLYPIVGALDGAFMAYDPATGELGVTVDGSTLEFRGQVDPGWTGQDPFVVLDRRSDSATVRLIDPWPGGATFDVPTPAPLEVTRIGDTVRVQSPSKLYISTDQGRSWTAVPIGVENGFPEGGLLLPTEALIVIAPNPDGSGSILYTPRS